MSTVIDALLVTLGLDSSSFTKGAVAARKAQDQIREDAQATQKTLDKTGKDQATAQKKRGDDERKRNKDAEERNKKVAESFAQVRNQVIGLMGAFTAGLGLKEFVSTLTAIDAAAGRSANNLGISGDELARWQNVAAQTGGSAAGVLSSFQRITDAALDIRYKGMTPLIQEWMRFGIRLSDNNGKLKNVGSLALEVSKRMKDLGLSARDAQYWGKQLGFDEGTVNVLLKGPEAVRKMLSETQGLSEADKAAAIARDAAFNKLEKAAFAVGRTIATKLTPAILAITSALEEFSGWLSEHGEAATAVFVGLGAAAAVIGAVLIGPVVAGFVAVSAAAAAFAAMAAGIGAAAYEVYEHWEEVCELLEGLFKGVSKVFWNQFGWIITAVEKVAKFLDGHAGPRAGGGRGATNAGAKTAPAAPPTSSAAAAVPAVPSGRGHGAAPRGIRNNNPGNLDFAGQTGATREGGPGGRFAVFGSIEQGVAALARQLQLYGKRGNDTIRGIISKFAPPSENNTKAYIEAVAKKLGIGAGDHLNLKDPGVLRELIQGITNVEVGRGQVSLAQINAGLALGAPGAALASGSVTNNQSHQVSNETSIGSIVIQTQDGAGAAAGFQRLAQQRGFVQQSTMGVAG